MRGLDKKAIRAIDDAWTVGKDIDGIQLSNWTHKKDSPWTKAKERNLSVIPNEDMTSYFRNFISVK